MPNEEAIKCIEEKEMNKDRNKHGVYIPADLWEQLKAFCEKHYNVSCSAVICRAIKELIERENSQ